MLINLISTAKMDSSHSSLLAFSISSKTEISKTTKSKRNISNVNEQSIAKIRRTDVSKFLDKSLTDKIITGKMLESVIFREINLGNYRHMIVLGAGDPNELTGESLRQLGAACYEAAGQTKAQDMIVDLDSIGMTKSNASQFVQAFTEGLNLAAYKFDEFKSKKNDINENNLSFFLQTKYSQDRAVKESFQQAIMLSEAVCFSRRLGDMPANHMTPTIFANEVEQAAKGTGIKVTVWDKARIKKEKMGGLLGVSLGSAEEPRFIIMEYHGGKKSEKPIAFVGKGLTFDSGGISIKPSAAMEEMKYDMCGGANVAGALLAIAKLNLKINVVGLIASTENMPGPHAVKPGDVLVARNGKSFEVNNTDAEGRLILADALSYASELEPKMIIDAATLTGAMTIALGNIHTGYFTRSEILKNKIEKAAKSTGELVWNMPLTDFHTKDMKGTFADLSNTSSSKGAGSATAAAFLEQFVATGIPWAHFDIAGTAWAVGGRLNYCSKKGASGVMIRTFVQIAKNEI